MNDKKPVILNKVKDLKKKDSSLRSEWQASYVRGGLAPIRFDRVFSYVGGLSPIHFANLFQ